MIEKCSFCGNKIDYSMSDVHLIPETNPQETGIEGICSKCMSHVYVKFRAFEAEITKFDEFMNEKEKEVIKLS